MRLDPCFGSWLEKERKALVTAGLKDSIHRTKEGRTDSYLSPLTKALDLRPPLKMMSLHKLASIIFGEQGRRWRQQSVT